MQEEVGIIIKDGKFYKNNWNNEGLGFSHKYFVIGVL